MSISLAIVLLIVLAAEFTNGLTDAPNAIATVVATRVLSPLRAVVMAALLNVAGVLVTGTAVAVTIGKDIVRPEVIGLHTVGAAVLTVVIWSTVTWRFGLPTSETHELVAGLAGAGLATAGASVLLWQGWQKVLMGFGIFYPSWFLRGTTVMVAIYWLFRRANRAFVNPALLGGFGLLFPRLLWLLAMVAMMGKSLWEPFPWRCFWEGCYPSFKCPFGLFSFAGSSWG